MNTCATCQHFIKMPQMERMAECYLNPPTMFSSGQKMRPSVRPSDFACGGYKERPADQEAPTKDKTRPNRK